MRFLIKYIVTTLFCILVICEFILGLQQVLGIRTSGHACFVMTGSFANPAPYGGLMAVMLATLGVYVIHNRIVRQWYDKALVILSSVSCVMCIIVLPASMSRAAWLSLGASAIVFGFKESESAKWIRRHKTAAAIGSVILIVAITGAFFLKRDSGIGRFHIWHMEIRAIADEPWSGHGQGTVLGVYGNTQAKYFAENDRAEIIKKVAGCPEYAFNEYLKIGVEYGVPAMLGVIIVLALLIALLLKFRSPLAYGLIALSVFAFFSYPLEAVHVKSDAEKEWDSKRYLSGLELYEDAVAEFAPLYADLKDNYIYLYDYGYALHKCQRHQESNEILKEGAAISSDPMFYNIVGKNYEAMGLYEEAEQAYLHAHHMVPQRLYPLTLLMRMHIRLGNNNEALRYGKMILAKPVNERHRSMLRLQADARHCVDSLMLLI